MYETKRHNYVYLVPNKIPPPLRVGISHSQLQSVGRASDTTSTIVEYMGIVILVFTSLWPSTPESCECRRRPPTNGSPHDRHTSSAYRISIPSASGWATPRLIPPTFTLTPISRDEVEALATCGVKTLQSSRPLEQLIELGALSLKVPLPHAREPIVSPEYYDRALNVAIRRSAAQRGNARRKTPCRAIGKV